MTMDVRDRVLDALGSGLAVTEVGADTLLIRLPFAFADGHLLQVSARRLAADSWTLSDRGQTAAALWDYGIDLSTGVANRSWHALLSTVELPPAMEESDTYTLAMSCDSSSLGTDVLRLGEAMLLADGLRALKRPVSRARLSARIIAAASELHTVGILPGAKMRTLFGAEREVTVKLTGPTHNQVFTQGLGGAKSASYDHARSIFADSAVPKSERLVVVGLDAGLQNWQRRALETVAIVTAEDDLADSLRSILAA